MSENSLTQDWDAACGRAFEFLQQVYCRCWFFERRCAISFYLNP